MSTGVGFFDVLTTVNWQLFLVSFIVFVTTLKFARRRKNTPPGPKGWPVIGYVKGVASPHCYLHLTDLKKEYGSDVISFAVAGRLVVVLNSYETIKQAFLKQGDVFSGRPSTLYKNFVAKGNGIVTSEGASWKTQRKFSLTILRAFGMGKLRMEDKILDEIGHFIETVEKHGGTPFDIRPLFTASVSNIIAVIVFGHRFDYDDVEFMDILQRLNENLRYGGATNPVNVMPPLRHLPGDKFHFHLMMGNLKHVLDYAQKEIDSHRESYQKGNPRDFIDFYLGESDRQHNKTNGHIDNAFNDGQLRCDILDLLTAGSDTTNTTLQWAMIYLGLHPNIQERIQKELDDVIGRRRLPRIADRCRLDYTEAAFLEVQRIASIGPLGLPHTATEDANFLGYDIAKGSMMIPNIWSVHHDDNLWEKPSEFIPERFLDSNGKFKPSEFVIPFSVGRRMCLGEALAKMELFLYLATLLQRFTIQLPPGDPVPDMRGTFGIARAPFPFKIMAVPRH